MCLIIELLEKLKMGIYMLTVFMIWVVLDVSLRIVLVDLMILNSKNRESRVLVNCRSCCLYVDAGVCGIETVCSGRLGLCSFLK